MVAAIINVIYIIIILDLIVIIQAIIGCGFHIL